VPTSLYGPCPIGHYCPAGTVTPIQCPPGTFNPLTNKFLVTDCLDCTAGFYCSSSGLSAVEGPCGAGYYCEVKSKEIKPIGKYCTAGKKCPVGSATMVNCPAGTYQNQDRQADCLTCPAGFFCPAGTADFTVNVCPAGYYCQAGTTSNNQYPCSVGQYNPSTGGQSSFDCLPCGAGEYCATTGLAAATGTCSGGYYCT
jgi:hypothetical protein